MISDFEYLFSKISNEDKESLRLLNDQLVACVIAIIAYLLFYQSTYEGIELILNKYRGEETKNIEPDVLSVESAYLFLIARLIFTNIAATRYNIVYNRAINGDINFSIEPNWNILTGNIFDMIADVYFIIGAEGIYHRDVSQPIFGM